MLTRTHKPISEVHGKLGALPRQGVVWVGGEGLSPWQLWSFMGRGTAEVRRADGSFLGLTREVKVTPSPALSPDMQPAWGAGRASHGSLPPPSPIPEKCRHLLTTAG